MEYIASRQNPLMIQTVKLLTARKHRRALGMTAAEGTKLLAEAIRWAPERLHAVILREGLVWPELPERTRRVTVPAKLMEQISATETPEGAIFLLELPAERAGEVVPGTLVLDGVQDPGNLGTILRTADALDVPVVLTDGCADPWSPKALRASMGAVLRTPPGALDHGALVAQCRARGVPLYAAALSAEAEDVRKTDVKHGAVVVGSEGQGVSQALLAASEKQVILPMHPRCESLNAAVAAALILWQMTEL